MSSEMQWLVITTDPHGGQVLQVQVLKEEPDEDFEVGDWVQEDGTPTRTTVVAWDETTNEGLDITDRFDHGTWTIPTGDASNIKREDWDENPETGWPGRD